MRDPREQLACEWLFVACHGDVLALRRQGDTYVLVGKDDQGGGSALDTDGSILVVGDYEAKGQRAGEGVVRIYDVGPDGLGGPLILKPTDPLPYDPGHPGSDYMPDPSPGKGFGSRVQLQGNWLLVEDSDGSHGFEHTSTGWQERWQHTHDGVGTLVDGALFVFNAYEARGLTSDSGALRIYDRSNNSWVERQRVVPAQRWSSWFGASFVVLPDRLLIGASGYGRFPYGAESTSGAIFDVPRGACSK